MSPVSAAHVRRPPTGRAAPRRPRPAWIAGLAIAAAALAAGGCASPSSSNAASPASASPASASPAGASAPADAASSQTPGPALDTSLDPCSLLTADQVAKAIGMKVSAGTPRTASLSDSRDCTWNTAYGEGAAYNCAKDVTGVVLVVVGPPPALKNRYPTAQSYFGDLRTTLRQTAGSVQQVSGIGDGAFAVTSAANKGLDLYATKGNVVLRVFSSCGSPAALRPELEPLLSQALAKTSLRRVMTGCVQRGDHQQRGARRATAAARVPLCARS